MILKDARIYVGALDLSGQSNKVSLEYNVEEIDTTTFDSGGFKGRVAGLLDVSFSAAGFWAAEPDATLTTDFASSTLVSVAPALGEGGVVYSVPGLLLKYSRSGDVGGALSYELEGNGRAQRLVRGKLLADRSVSASGNGTAYNVGAVGSSQYLYAALHVLSVTGSVTVKIQSDDASGFASPLDRITFTAATTGTWQWATPVAGPITDTWWRASWTVVTGPARIVVVMAIK